LPKPQARKVLQQLIGAKSSEHCVNGVKTTVDTCQCWKQNSGSFGRGTKCGSSSKVKDDRAIGHRSGIRDWDTI